MKKLYILLITLFALNVVKAQWVSQNSGTTNNLNSVYFADANTGYAVGDSGTILKTTNGGVNWENQSSGTLSNLYSVQFTDPLTGYTVGDNSIILKTIDGGENWLNQSAGVSVDLSSVSFPATDTGYVVGFFWDYPNNDTLYNYILKTNTGGNLWTISYLHKTVDDVGSARVWSVFFPDVNTGYAVGVIGMEFMPYLLKTTNGGIEWTSQTLYTNGALRSAYFLNPDTGYVVYPLLKTTNGGTDWTELNLGIEGGLNSIYFTDANTGYAVGINQYPTMFSMIVKTTDGGITWTIQYSGGALYSYLSSVFFTNENIGYAVGSGGAILKTTNGGGPPVGIKEITNDELRMTSYPNPFKEYVIFSYIIKETTPVTLQIFNSLGQLVAELVNTTQSKGEQHVQWNAEVFPTGIYYYQVQAGNESGSGKMTKY